ncbi:class I SAM-dependent methyltransferase [Marinospirillum perlucidum]|uniref:class I SAM-dependent methyltransferase n=1 Tax=Marinospirillum perlucidum TaxID=1982602 RepID=UPI000DF21D1A|nr:class I SAM-dependent methyltransferase [Marinospirillum perlucidum]
MTAWVLLVIGGLLLLVLVSVVVSTLKTGMSPWPSHAAARQVILGQVAQLLDQEDQDRVLTDLGSGWGHLVVPLARRYPHCRVIGYEVSFFPWLVSWLLKKLLRLDNLTLYRGDFLQAPWYLSDLVICYLVSPSMQALAEQLRQRQEGPRYLISHFFALPGYQPWQTLHLPDWYRSPLYFYRLTS